jgi:hypothetical protein
MRFMDDLLKQSRATRWNGARLETQYFEAQDHVSIYRDGAPITHSEFEELVSLGRRFYEAFSPSMVADLRIWGRTGDAARRVLSRYVSRPQDQPGFIYVLGGGPGVFKIGLTSSLTRRLKRLEIQLPFPVELIHTLPVDHMPAAELFFHTLFESKRLNGEWFALDEADIEFLKGQSEWSLDIWCFDPDGD